MITRKAIIVGNSGGYRGLDFLKGVNIDLDNYKQFLKSNAGGNWADDEMEILIDGTSEKLDDILNTVKEDYSFTVFTGHGYINSFTKDDTICLRDKDVSISKLVSQSKKQTIVIDACRERYPNKIDVSLNESFQKMFSIKYENSSERFNAALEKTPDGIILLFSCSPNETSGDNDYLGGYFSHSFIKAAKDFIESNIPKEVLEINHAFENAKIILNETFLEKQNPVMTGQIRRITFPPFAIK